jgi:hypothetical protein
MVNPGGRGRGRGGANGPSMGHMCIVILSPGRTVAVQSEGSTIVSLMSRS